MLALKFYLHTEAEAIKFFDIGIASQIPISNLQVPRVTVTHPITQTHPFQSETLNETRQGNCFWDPSMHG